MQRDLTSHLAQVKLCSIMVRRGWSLSMETLCELRIASHGKKETQMTSLPTQNARRHVCQNSQMIVRHLSLGGTHIVQIVDLLLKRSLFPVQFFLIQ
jgi:hypothetical protein